MDRDRLSQGPKRRTPSGARKGKQALQERESRWAIVLSLGTVSISMPENGPQTREEPEAWLGRATGRKHLERSGIQHLWGFPVLRRFSPANLGPALHGGSAQKKLPPGLTKRQLREALPWSVPS